MYRSLGQAAAATGVSKSTILRSIKAHRISATRCERTGDWEIDPAELHRLYAPAPAGNGEERAADRASTHGATAATAALEAQIAGLRDVAELLRRQLDDVREDRDHWRTTAQATQRLLAAPAQDAPAKPRRPSFWRWVGGAA